VLIDPAGGRWERVYSNGPRRRSETLFLDRDGVVVDEVHFLHRVADVRLAEGVAEAIAAVNAAGCPVVVVTNQSGIARGLFGWSDYEAVEDEIARRLKQAGARIDAVLACGYHAGGPVALEESGAAWRKPAPGMVLRGGELYASALARSYIVGDRLSDLSAGQAAGLAGGWLVRSGYGVEEEPKLAAARAGWPAGTFDARVVDGSAVAIRAFLETLR